MSRPSRASIPLLRPWKTLRRWLKRIDRQSASRSGGPWARATEYALILSLPIAIILAFVMDEFGVTVSSQPVVRVRLGRQSPDGPLIGRAIPLQADRVQWRFPIPVSEVVIERRTVRYGWPFAARTVQAAPTAIASPLLAPEERIDLSDRDEVEWVERLAQIDLEGAWEAVADTLDSEANRAYNATLKEIAADFRSERSVETRSGPSTFALFGVLWVLIFATSAGLIRVVQFIGWLAVSFRRNRIVNRLRNGQCPDCRYDLRAERFPKRCPECGRRIWA